MTQQPSRRRAAVPLLHDRACGGPGRCRSRAGPTRRVACRVQMRLAVLGRDQHQRRTGAALGHRLRRRRARNCARPPTSSCSSPSSPRKSPESASRVRSHTCEPSCSVERTSRSFCPPPGPRTATSSPSRIWVANGSSARTVPRSSVAHQTRSPVVRVEGHQVGGCVAGHRRDQVALRRWRRTPTASCPPARSTAARALVSSSIVKSGLSRVRTPMPCANADTWAHCS